MSALKPGIFTGAPSMLIPEQPLRYLVYEGGRPTRIRKREGAGLRPAGKNVEDKKLQEADAAEVGDPAELHKVQLVALTPASQDVQRKNYLLHFPLSQH